MFVNLGVKGSEKTMDALGSVKRGLTGIKDMSLEAKAAYAAAFYAIGRLVTESGQFGTNLKNLNALTGVSTKTFQQYAYAMKLAGFSGNEAAQAIDKIQSMIYRMQMGKGSPAEMALAYQHLINAGVKMSSMEWSIWGKNPELFLQRMAQFSQLKNIPEYIKTQLMRGIGFDDAAIATMKRGFTAQKYLNQAPLSSPGEIKQLDLANREWIKLHANIDRAFQKFTAAHGQQLAKDIGRITTAVIKLVEALTVLADRAKVFKRLEQSASGWAKIIELAGNTVSETPGMKPGQGILGYVGSNTWEATKNYGEVLRGLMIYSAGGGGKFPGVSSHSPSINQHFYLPPGMDAQGVGREAGREVRRVTQTSPANGGGR